MVSRILDGHVHVASMNFVPSEFARGVARNMCVAAAAKGMPVSEKNVMRMLAAQHQDHHADQLIAEMDKAGVEKAVLLAPDFSFALKDACVMVQLAAAHHAIRQRHPDRFFVFLGFDPRSGARGLADFERCIKEYGFEGLKLYPPCGYSPSDERLFPAYELCEQLGLPVLLHTGPTSPALSFEFAHPNLIEKAAFTFPNVNFILAHGGVNHTHEAALLCAYRPNVYLDIAAFQAVLSPDGWAPHLHRLFRCGINHKIIFGTDWPVCRMSGSHESVVQILTSVSGPLDGLPDEERSNILGGNLLRLLAKRIPAANASQRGHSIEQVDGASILFGDPRFT